MSPPPRLGFARVALFAASLFVALAAPVRARAGGVVVTPAGTPAPAISVRMAIAIGGGETTRWSEVTLPPGPAVGWLVPVRPGAAVEWAPNAWLASLDRASAPRVLVPLAEAPCELHQSFEAPASWVAPAGLLAPAPIALPTSAADVEAWAEGRGLAVGAAETERLRALYVSGWRVAAVELAASENWRTSPTLRVTDQGGAILPLSLGAPATATAITLFVIGDGHATLSGMRELDDRALEWGAHGSSYADLRRQLLGDEGWLRESSSNRTLFDELFVTFSVRVPPVVTTYFDDPSCAAEVRARGTSDVVLTPAALTCGSRTDLALALASTPPASAVVTRIAGLLPAGRVAGTPEITLTDGPPQPPVRTAATYDRPCPAGGGIDVDPRDGGSSSPSPSPSPSSPSRPRSPGQGGGAGAGGGGGSGAGSDTSVVYAPSDGCGGGGGTYVAEEPDDSSSDSWDSSDSSDSCSSDTSSTSSDSSDSSDGWDSSDSSDSCSSDTTDTTDTSSSSDGWDSSDSNCSTTKHRKRRGPSPLSRLTLFAVAMLLPLRRLYRPRTGERK